MFFFQLKPTSIEKEVFPFMANDNDLYAMELQGKMSNSAQIDKKFLVKNHTST